jgi:hypothetical protein
MGKLQTVPAYSILKRYDHQDIKLLSIPQL